MRVVQGRLCGRRTIQEFLARGSCERQASARLPKALRSKDWYPDHLAILTEGANVAWERQPCRRVSPSLWQTVRRQSQEGVRRDLRRFLRGELSRALFRDEMERRVGCRRSSCGRSAAAGAGRAGSNLLVSAVRVCATTRALAACGGGFSRRSSSRCSWRSTGCGMSINQKGSFAPFCSLRSSIFWRMSTISRERRNEAAPTGFWPSTRSMRRLVMPSSRPTT